MEKEQKQTKKHFELLKRLKEMYHQIHFYSIPFAFLEAFYTFGGLAIFSCLVLAVLRIF
ncbi:hypothetical protein ACI3E1_07330 [Ligilactobacillus sp. LYQ139]|uniref:hypothetical protein n=1 Tax=Ligilactobacillus sp. LYQ139 TaxID=3378800 RepID=UPI0038541D38